MGYHGYVPDKVTDGIDDVKDELNEGKDNVNDALDDGKDKLDDLIPDIDIDINVDDYLPSNIQKKLGDGAETIAKMMREGYDNLDVKGNYIDPWTDKVLDYADFNVVVPKANKTLVKGTKKDD